MATKRQSALDVDPDQPYPMSLSKLGHAVIVNNVASEMPGSNADVTALQTAYEKVGFQVHVHKDLNSQKMVKLKKWIMEESTHEESNCFLLSVICHGNDKGQLLDVDKKKAWDIELFVGELSCVDTLTGKPKILIFQCCRGSQVNEGRPAHYLAEEQKDTLMILPNKADMFLAYATVLGFKAHAGDEKGSLYLQTLAGYMQQEYMRRPLNKILQMVRLHMIKKSEDKQCPEEKTSLLYDVMFSEFHKKRQKPAAVARETSEEEPEDYPDDQIQNEVAQEMELKELEEKMQKMAPPSEKQVPVKQEVAYSPPPPPQYRKLTRKFEVKLVSSRNIDIPLFTCDFTVMPKTGLVLMRDEKKLIGRRQFVKSLHMSRGIKGITVKLACNHRYNNGNLCGLVVAGQEWMATTCLKCEKLRLIDPVTDKAVTAYDGWSSELCPADGKLYCATYLDYIEEFDCSSTKFKKIRTLQTGMRRTRELVHVSKLNYLVLSGSSNGDQCEMRAVSLGGDPAVVWKLQGEVAGFPFRAHSMTVYKDTVLVLDWTSERILFIDPGTGECVQVENLPAEAPEVAGIHVYQDQIIMAATRKLAYFSISEI